MLRYGKGDFFVFLFAAPGYYTKAFAKKQAVLRTFAGLEHRTEIIALIDGDLEPDAREWKIKNTYPEEYRFLLQNCYPALRHTDYRIAYTIRSYTKFNNGFFIRYSFRTVFVDSNKKGTQCVPFFPLSRLFLFGFQPSFSRFNRVQQQHGNGHGADTARYRRM